MRCHGLHFVKGVVDSEGRDRTEQLLGGAYRAFEIAKAAGAREAIWKERSPSCGLHQIYLGKERVSGRGVFAALLERDGVNCRSDEEVK